MAILKNTLKSNYTKIPNNIIISSISNEAFRLLVYLYSKPNNWQVVQKNIATEFGVSDRTIARWFDELKKIGFVEINRDKNKFEYILNHMTNMSISTRQICQKAYDKNVIDKYVMTNMSEHNKTNTTKTEYNNKTEINNTKEELIDCYFENSEINILFNEFLNNRIELFGKKINTERSINRLVNKLNKYSDDAKKRMIDTAIARGYRDVFESKQSKSSKGIDKDYLDSL